VIGVLDVSGDHRSYHQHTMALAKMSVQMIENQLFTSAFQETLRLSFHGRPEFLGTLMEGIVAFTGDGRFLSANRTAQFQLGMPLAALRAHTLNSLFQITSAQLIDLVRRSPGRHLTLNLSNGTVVCARAEFKRAPLAVQAAAVAPVSRFEGAKTPPALSRLDGLDTGDPQVASVITKVRKVMGKDIPILITGETGTGKELFAQAIHNDSPRHQGPFVAVNCASIPDSLIESELFGYEEGAFTGARRKGATGKLLQANGGTLFLDEIGDMPYSLQVRLLRVLQERVVNPLGSAKTIPVDIAIICATHRNLRDMIAQNLFREDLYYRLNGLVVRLPALRDRTDVAVVIEKVLQYESFSTPHQTPLTVSPDVMVLFERCTWPGNFRQLSNLLRTAAAMVDDDREIRREHLPDDFFDDLRDGVPASAETSGPRHEGRLPPASLVPVDAPLREVETSAVAAALARHGGNVSAAARSLGVSRNFIYRKMAAGALNKAS
jgi:transcriptional regulator of acetoin/glycerol metabolism